MVDQPSPLVLPWFIRHNNYKESITLQNKTKSFKNTRHLFLPIFLFYYNIKHDRQQRVKGQTLGSVATFNFLRAVVSDDGSLAISIFLYACESWTLTLELEKRTQAFEMRCYRRLLNISYKDHVTNEEVRRKIQAAIGEYDELLNLVKKRKLRWFGHVSRFSGLAKSIIQGTVKGKRKRGTQKKRWKDNIKV